MDAHLGGAVSALGRVDNEEHVHKLYFVDHNELRLEPKQISLLSFFIIHQIRRCICQKSEVT